MGGDSLQVALHLKLASVRALDQEELTHICLRAPKVKRLREQVLSTGKIHLPEMPQSAQALWMALLLKDISPQQVLRRRTF